MEKNKNKANLSAGWVVPIDRPRPGQSCSPPPSTPAARTPGQRVAAKTLALFHQLIPIVQQNIADAAHPRAVFADIRRGDAVGKLVVLAEDRPFLREVERPAAPAPVGRIDRVEDVLDDARLLVVGLLDEKAVVFDAFDGGFFFGLIGGES